MVLRRLLSDWLFAALCGLAVAASLVVLAQIAASSLLASVAAVASEGLGVLVEPPGPPGGRLGGLGPVVLNTGLMAGLALLLAAPVGVAVGVYLGEEEGGLARALSIAVHTLSEIPTVVIGLFVFAVVCVPMRSYSLLAGSLSLAAAVLPFIVTQTREAVRAVPREYREAAYSLGLSRWKTVWLVLVPMSGRGLASAVLLGYAKALGETAPLLLTAGFALHGFYGLTGPSSALSLVVYRFGQTPYENYRTLAWVASALLFAASVGASLLVRRLFRGVRF